MKKRIKKTNQRLDLAIKKAVSDALKDSFATVLHDITYRIDSLMQVGLAQAGLPHKVTSEMLNLAMPILDGFAFTNNSPTSGYVAWTDCNVVYKGTKYSITNANSNKKYIYWTLATTPTAFQSSDTKPTLTVDDILIAVNNGGTYQMVIGEGRMVNGAIINDGTIGTTEIGSAAVTTAKIASSAITSGLLASGAVTSGALASGAVTSGAIASGAVGATAIASGAVGTSQLAASAVDNTKLAAGAVTSGAIAANAVTSAAIASGAVGSTQIASGAVGSTQIADGSVGSTEIATGGVATGNLADSAVTAAKIGAGQIATDKLNVATHMLF